MHYIAFDEIPFFSTECVDTKLGKRQLFWATSKRAATIQELSPCVVW